MNNSTFPKTIFKFENACKQSIINFKSQVLYMASPIAFNDPYDCAINMKIADLKYSDIARIKKKYLERSDVPIKIKHEIESTNDEKMKSILYKAVEKTIFEKRDEFLNNYGVCCFSEDNENLLMWAHYSESYKGFCLEFNTNKEPFNKIRKVEYLESIPEFDIASYIIDGQGDQILKLFCTKAENWKYEKEWRLLHKEANTKYSYCAESLKAIYFGPRIEPELKEILCLILLGQNLDVDLYNSKLGKECYSIKFDKFEYLPYIEAKRRGLRE